MAASLRVGSNVWSLANPANITNATGHAAGDIIVIVASYYDPIGATCTIPGFTSFLKVEDTTGPYPFQEWFWKLDGGSEPSSYSGYVCTSTFVEFVCFAVTGAIPTNPIGVTSGIGSFPTGNQLVIPSMSVPSNNSLLMGFYIGYLDTSTAPYPITFVSNRGDAKVVLMGGDSVSSGPTGSKTILTTASTGPSCGGMVAFQSGPSTSSPANVLAVQGDVAAFTVLAVTSGGALSYQWLLNGNVIPGATSATYTTGALLLSDNGNQYSCVVTDSNASTTSGYAVLTVLSAFSLFADRAGATRFDFKVGPAPDPSLFDLYAVRGGATLVDLIVPAVAATIVTGENLFFGSGSTQ